VDGEPDLAAGDFSSWLTGMQAALRGEVDAEVPCGGCTACCTASQFIHIGPDETDTLAHIPAGLLVPAPRLPRGHVVLGYDERGHCPMLVDGRCSIYEHRPRTCRTYDCRIFPAAGLEIAGEDKAGIARQARRWRFSHPTPGDEAEHDAVRAAAAALLAEHDGNVTEVALLAIDHAGR
jgi:Fe-S-cluster containining protein